MGEEARHVVEQHGVVPLRGSDELHHQIVHHVPRHEPHRVLLVQVQLGGHLWIDGGEGCSARMGLSGRRGCCFGWYTLP